MIPLGIPRCKWEDEGKVYLKEKGWKILDQTDLSVYRYQCCAVVNTMMNHWASRKAGEFVDQKIGYKFLKKVQVQ